MSLRMDYGGRTEIRWYIKSMREVFALYAVGLDPATARVHNGKLRVEIGAVICTRPQTSQQLSVHPPSSTLPKLRRQHTMAA